MTSEAQNSPKKIRNLAAKDSRHYRALSRKLFDIETAFAQDYIQVYARTHQLKSYANSTMSEIAPIAFYLYAYGLVLANQILKEHGKEDEQEIILACFAVTRKPTPDNAYQEAMKSNPEQWRKKALKKTLGSLATDETMKQVVGSMTPMLTEAFNRYYNQVETTVEEWEENEF